MTSVVSHLLDVQARRREAAAALLLLGGVPRKMGDGRMPGCPHCGDPRIATDDDGKYFIRKRAAPRLPEPALNRA